eukprot:403347435
MQEVTQSIEEIPIQNNNVDKENLDPQLNERFMRMLRYNSRMDKIYLDFNFSTEIIIHQLKFLNEIFPEAKFYFEKYDPIQPNHIFEVLTQSANNFHINADHFPDLFRLQKKELIILKYFAVSCFRKVISLDSHHPEYFVISDYHNKKITRIVLETAQCIEQIAPTKYFDFLLTYQSMEGIIDYLDRDDDNLVFQAMICLKWYITKSKSWGYKVMNTGVISKISKFIKNSSPSSPKFLLSIWILTLFYKESHYKSYDLIYDAVPAINNALILIEDEDAIIDLLWATSFNCQVKQFQANFFRNFQNEQSIVKRLLELTSHENYEIFILAIRSVAFLSSYADLRGISFLANEGAIGVMSKHLDHVIFDVRIEAIWTLSHIAAGDTYQIQQIQDSGALDKIIINLQCDRYESLKFAAILFSNLSKQASLQQLHEVIEKGVLKYLIEIQHSFEIIEVYGFKAVQNLLQGIGNYYENINQLDQFFEIMENQGILSYLCQCQHQYSQEVQAYVDQHLSKFFASFGCELKEWKQRKLHHKVYHDYNQEIFNF